MVFQHDRPVVILGPMLTDQLKSQRPKGREGLAEWYREVLKDRRVKGLTVAEVASSIGVTEANVYYWERRLRDGVRKKARARVSKGMSSKRLVRVTIKQEAPCSPVAGRHGLLEVHLGRSRSVMVPAGFDSDDLQRVVTALESC